MSVPKLLPMLTDEDEGGPAYIINMDAFCLVEGLSLVTDLNAFDAARPPDLPANAPVAQRQARDAAYLQWTGVDSKFYGYLILSWTQVPMLRDRLLATAAVLASPRRGSVLFQAYRDDIYANPNPTIYVNRLTRIRAYRQKTDMPVATALGEINKMQAGLPPAYARTDQDKLLQLRQSLLPRYGDIVKTLSLGNPLLTYSAACEHLVRESVSESLLSLSHVGEREDAHLVAEPCAADALLIEDRGRSRTSDRGGGYRGHVDDRSPSRDRGRGYQDRGRSYSQDRGRGYSQDRGRGSSQDRGRRRSRDNHRDHSNNRGRSDSRGRSQDRSPSRDSYHSGRSNARAGAGARGRSPSPYPRAHVSWADIVCHKCKRKGHKAFECGKGRFKRY